MALNILTTTQTYISAGEPQHLTQLEDALSPNLSPSWTSSPTSAASSRDFEVDTPDVKPERVGSPESSTLEASNASGLDVTMFDKMASNLSDIDEVPRVASEGNDDATLDDTADDADLPITKSEEDVIKELFDLDSAAFNFGNDELDVM
jgi:hypothetical protein